MAKYIELDVVKKAFQNMDAGRKHGSTLLTPEEFAEYFDELPFVDVIPVRIGFWIPIHKDPLAGYDPKLIACNSAVGYECSLCRNEAMCSCNDVFLSNYCPNCGAKMEGVKYD